MTRYHATFDGDIPFTEEEEAAADAAEAAAAEYAASLPDPNIALIRERRNELLKESDWMANSDVTMSDEWKAYRQELRDIPQHPDFPDHFVRRNGAFKLPNPPTD